MVELDLSLFGHPVAGNRWDLKMDTSVQKADFVQAPQWKAVYKQPKTGAGLGVYVDDFELVASAEDTPKIWKELEKHIEFKEPYHIWGEEPTRHLGCEYRVYRKSEPDGHTKMTVNLSMGDYF